MPEPTIRRLLGTRELGLSLLTPEDALPSAALDASVSWAHGSDLADPSPFLVPGQLLLTTGTQFGRPAAGTAGPDAATASTSGGKSVGSVITADRATSSRHAAAAPAPAPAPVPAAAPARAPSDSPADSPDSDYDGYVDRLVGAGIAGLGFGVGVVRETPPGLLAACARAGLPLLEVPYRTPFIAIARAVADLLAEQAYARNTWALGALRAVSLAALRPDRLSATLAELARQLGRWVALVDASGSVAVVHPARALTTDARARVESESRRMLSAGRRAASTVAETGTVVSLQTIGAPGRLLGVLAHGGTGDVDQAAQQVVTSVVALAGPALDREHGLESAHDAMRVALMRSLESTAALLDGLEGDAKRTADDRIGAQRSPGRRTRASAPHSSASHSSAPRSWARNDAAAGGSAPNDSALNDSALNDSVAIERIRARVEASARSAGVDSATRVPGVGRGGPAGPGTRLARGDAAAAARKDVSSTTGNDASAAGWNNAQPAIRNDVGAAAPASTLLAPLRARDPEGVLADSLRVWLEHNGVYDAAARELGVHRHTLTARIRTIEQLAGLDFDSFADRVKAWDAVHRELHRD